MSIPRRYEFMDVFVAAKRFSIVTRILRIRIIVSLQRRQNLFDGTDSTSATSQVIANTLFSAGLEGMLGGKRRL